LRGKHAAVKDTPGTVTKLIGIVDDRSRWDCVRSVWYSVPEYV
jgi:hypothetical protein